MTTLQHTMKTNLLSFLQIFKEKGNADHAALESGFLQQDTTPNPTADLKSIPQSEHHNYLHHTIPAPQEIQHYINTAESLSVEEINNLEIGMEKFHKIDTSKH